MPRHCSRLQQFDPSNPQSRQVGFASRPFATPPKSEAEARTHQTDGKPAPKAGYAIITEGGRTLPIQPKLTIGAPNDKYEQEADLVAKEVVQRLGISGGKPLAQDPEQPTHPNQTLPEEDELQMNPLTERIQRVELPEDDELQMKPLLQREMELDEEDELQMKPDFLQRKTDPNEEDELQMKPLFQQHGSGSVAASDDLESAIQQSRGGGQPLADSIREPMEQAFGGVDFSGVNVHTDGRSDQLNRSLQAKAFTTGQNVFFRQGAYESGARGGQKLLAHELTHVVQQNGKLHRQTDKLTESTPSEATQSGVVAEVVTPKNLSSIPSGNLVQRAQGLPTDQDLIAAGHKAGTKLFSKSAFAKILEDLQAFSVVNDDDIDGQVTQLIQLLTHITEWRNSPDRRKMKRGDAGKRTVLQRLEKQARRLLIQLASSDQLRQDPQKLRATHQAMGGVITAPHVNDAINQEVNLRTDKFKNKTPVFKIPATINCALCACAAVIRHVTGLGITTGDIIARKFSNVNHQELHSDFNGELPSDYQTTYQHPGSLKGVGYSLPSNPLAQLSQVERINAANVESIQEFCALFGVAATKTVSGQELQTAVTSMSKMMHDHVFAVLISGAGHWNFAHQGSNGDLEFIDYQSDHAEYGGTATGQKPQVGIVNKDIKIEKQITTFIAFQK